MNKFKTFKSVAIPLIRNNIDTDAIIPKQYLKAVSRQGFGNFLFDDWRYKDPGNLDVEISKRKIPLIFYPHNKFFLFFIFEALNVALRQKYNLYIFKGPY